MTYLCSRPSSSASPSRSRRSPSRAGAASAASRRSLLTAVVLVVLTAVFDNVMIATGSVRLRRRASRAPRVGLAPVEDFAYPIAGALLLAGLWNLIAREDRYATARTDRARGARSTARCCSRVAPAELGQHRLPVRRRLPADDPRGRRWRSWSAPSSSSCPTTSRCTASTTSSTTSPTLRTRARAASRARCSTAEPAPAHDHRRVVLCVPFVVVLVALGGPASWAVLAVSLFAVAAYSVPGLRFKERAVPRLAHLEHALREPGGLRARARGRGLHARSCSRCSPRSSLGASRATRSGRCRTSCPTARAASPRSPPCSARARTVRFAIAMWLAAGVLMLATAWPGPLAAVLVVPYVVDRLAVRGRHRRRVGDARTPAGSGSSASTTPSASSSRCCSSGTRRSPREPTSRRMSHRPDPRAEVAWPYPRRYDAIRAWRARSRTRAARPGTAPTTQNRSRPVASRASAASSASVSTTAVTTTSSTPTGTVRSMPSVPRASQTPSARSSAARISSPIAVATDRSVTPAHARSAWSSRSAEHASEPSPPVARCEPCPHRASPPLDRRRDAGRRERPSGFGGRDRSVGILPVSLLQWRLPCPQLPRRVHGAIIRRGRHHHNRRCPVSAAGA